MCRCFYLCLDLVLSRIDINALCISSKYPQQHKTSSSLTSVYFPPEINFHPNLCRLKL